MFTFNPNFTSTTSYKSKITFINDNKNILLHHNFPINQLTTNSNYLKIYYILLNNKKPTQKQYNKFKTTITHHTIIHKQITHLFHTFHHNSHPITIIYNITNTLTTFYHNSLNINNPHHHKITTFHLLSKIPTITTIYYKYSINQPFIYPHNNLSYTNNFLNIMFSTPYKPYKINPILKHTINHILILHTNHKQNTSTSTIHTTNSSNTNPFTYITTNITSL